MEDDGSCNFVATAQEKLFNRLCLLIPITTINFAREPTSLWRISWAPLLFVFLLFMDHPTSTPPTDHGPSSIGCAYKVANWKELNYFECKRIDSIIFVIRLFHPALTPNINSLFLVVSAFPGLCVFQLRIIMKLHLCPLYSILIHLLFRHSPFPAVYLVDANLFVNRPRLWL